MTVHFGVPVALIIPPSIFLLDERVFMTLGLLRVAAVLEAAGRRVEVLDFSGVENPEDALREYLARTDVRDFGLTATTPQMPAAHMLRAVIRDACPDGRIIIGGPHVTLVNAAAKQEARRNRPGRAVRTLQTLLEYYDVVVAGDGEIAVFDALHAEARGLIDADEPRSTLFLDARRLSELPFPARHLVDAASYNYAIDGVRAMSLIAQLGCPFECGFCGGRRSPMLRRVRMRSSDSVVAELRHLHEAFGVRGFMLYDDELNVNPQMIPLMRMIARLQEELGTDFRLRGFIKAELFDDEQAEAMRRAGFRWILTGFESGSPRILENINKKSTRDDNTRCIEIARRHGLKVKALMSIGHPGETDDTARDTLDWLLEVRPDDFDLTIITTYPGTPYYDEAVPHPDIDGVWTYTFAPTGDRLHSHEIDYNVTADYYKGNPDGGYRSFVFTDSLTAEELVILRDRTEREVRTRLGIPFYSSKAALRYEHSMGQSGPLLPARILRVSGAAPPR